MALSGGCDKTSLVGIHLQGSQSTDKRETHPELVLESDQASYVEDGLQEEKCFFLMLPSEIIYRILEFLQHNDVLRVICVCRTLKQIADTDQIWRVFLHRHCRAGHLGAVVPSDLALCNFTERVQILKLTETKGSKHVFRQLFGPRWWPQAFSDEVLLRLGLGGQGNARGVPNSQRNGRQRGSHRASHGADKPLCDRERRGGGRAKGGDVRLLGNGLFVFRAGPICNDAPWICPHCHTFVPRQPSRKRDVRVSAYKRDEDGSHAACEDASIQQDADGVMLDMSPPSCPECKNAAPPLVQSLRDGTCVVGMGSSVVGDRGKYPRSVDPHCLRVWATTFTNPPTVVRTLQPNGPEQGVFAVGDDRPNRVGLQFPFVGVGMHSGRLVVMDVRTGMVGATLPPPDEFVDTVVWMVLWGAPGQLFLLFGDSTIVEWQVCLTPVREHACNHAAFRTQRLRIGLFLCSGSPVQEKLFDRMKTSLFCRAARQYSTVANYHMHSGYIWCVVCVYKCEVVRSASAYILSPPIGYPRIQPNVLTFALTYYLSFILRMCLHSLTHPHTLMCLLTHMLAFYKRTWTYDTWMAG
eukprot:m.880177 g.880177  ORF g.880177 m.880177 type:complete len:580 (+) comp23590_c0_seq10:366-2105(+)